ncbi:MAG: class I SAM-dependent methyltransferase [Bacteroidales bacterium]
MDNLSKQQIADYYNTYAKKQINIGLNIRHYHLFYKIIKAGLKKNHKILEIGCGIGTLTKLIHNYINNGYIVGVDISSENIRIATERFKKSKKCEFVVSDMTDFSYNKKFDFIILPDVLEHIPIDQHKNLFSVLSAFTHENSKVIINIPHPNAINYIKNTDPSKLQIIDQSLHADWIVKLSYEENFELLEYNAYSLTHIENDYVYIVLKKRTEKSIFTSKKTSSIIINKLQKRIYFWFKTI